MVRSVATSTSSNSIVLGSTEEILTERRSGARRGFGAPQRVSGGPLMAAREIVRRMASKPTRKDDGGWSDLMEQL